MNKIQRSKKWTSIYQAIPLIFSVGYGTNTWEYPSVISGRTGRVQIASPGSLEEVRLYDRC